MGSFFPTFPGSYFGNEYGPQDPSQQFPIDAFRQNALANNLGGGLGGDYLSSDYQQLMQMFQPGPATKTFMDYIQNAPQHENYEPGTGAKILSAIQGLGYGLLGKPDVGGQMAKATLDQKYNDALENYKLKGTGLQEAANLEQNQQKAAGSLLPQIASMREKAQEFGITSGQKDTEIANTAKYQDSEAANTAERNRIAAEQNKIDQAFKMGSLSLQQKEAASKALLESAQADYYRGFGRQPNGPRADRTERLPSFESDSTKAHNEILLNKVLNPYLVEDNGKVHVDTIKLMKDPAALIEYANILRKYNLMGGSSNEAPKQ